MVIEEVYADFAEVLIQPGPDVVGCNTFVTNLLLVYEALSY